MSLIHGKAAEPYLAKAAHATICSLQKRQGWKIEDDIVTDTSKTLAPQEPWPTTRFEKGSLHTKQPSCDSQSGTKVPLASLMVKRRQGL